MIQILKSLSSAYGAYTIARDDRVILIKGAIPGEVVEAEIVEKKKDYFVAVTKNVLEPSEFRVEPECSVFGICGGCHLQYIDYQKQLSMKKEILSDTLSRLGNTDIEIGNIFSDDQWHYRHRAQFKVSKTGDIGFFRESSRDVVAIDRCPLMRDEINALLKDIMDAKVSIGLLDIYIVSGEKSVILLKGSPENNGICKKLASTGIAGIALNDDICKGEGFTSFDLNGLQYTVSPWTFFQAHWKLNRRVVSYILERLMPLDGKHILDLYAGAGNFSMQAALYAEDVTAVEENQHAIEDGMRNLKINDIKNYKFIRTSAEKYKINKKYDIIFLDPPRTGLTSEVVSKILESPADDIVYISCNPATLARDVKKLKNGYSIESVDMIEFFPNTYHIESIVFLKKR